MFYTKQSTCLLLLLPARARYLIRLDLPSGETPFLPYYVPKGTSLLHHRPFKSFAECLGNPYRLVQIRSQTVGDFGYGQDYISFRNRLLNPLSPIILKNSHSYNMGYSKLPFYTPHCTWSNICPVNTYYRQLTNHSHQV